MNFNYLQNGLKYLLFHFRGVAAPKIAHMLFFTSFFGQLKTCKCLLFNKVRSKNTLYYLGK